MYKGETYIRKCRICGKEFSTYSAGAGWIYKAKMYPNGKNGQYNWYCSYKCYMVYRKPIEEKEKERARRYEQDE